MKKNMSVCVAFCLIFGVVSTGLANGSDPGLEKKSCEEIFQLYLKMAHYFGSKVSDQPEATAVDLDKNGRIDGMDVKIIRSVMDQKGCKY